jgi:hypothetical protein
MVTVLDFAIAGQRKYHFTFIKWNAFILYVNVEMKWTTREKHPGHSMSLNKTFLGTLPNTKKNGFWY